MSFKFLILFLVLILALTGCTFSLTATPSGVGIFKSFDYAEHWEQKNFAGMDGKRKLSISGVETREIIIDPHDHLLIFLATRANGLFISENGGEEWQRVFEGGFVSSVAPDSKQRGVAYIAVSNKIYKTIDLGKHWRMVYLETRPQTQVMQVAVDPHNGSKLIASTSSGEILISQDAGESWNLAAKLKGVVRKILINPHNPQIVYAGTLKKGLYKSIDGGQTWEDIKDNYLPLGRGNLEYRFLTWDPSVKDGLFLVTRYGIIRTQDGGQTWQALELLTPPTSVLINAFAVNSTNAKHIYYATDNTIYRSFDGGKSWLSTRVPTNNAPIYLAVDPETSNVIYMGIYKIKKKAFFLL